MPRSTTKIRDALRVDHGRGKECHKGLSSACKDLKWNLATVSHFTPICFYSVQRPLSILQMGKLRQSRNNVHCSTMATEPQNLSMSRHVLSILHLDWRSKFSKSLCQMLPWEHRHHTHGAKSDHENAARGTSFCLPRAQSDGMLQPQVPATARVRDISPFVSVRASVPRQG